MAAAVTPQGAPAVAPAPPPRAVQVGLRGLVTPAEPIEPAVAAAPAVAHVAVAEEFVSPFTPPPGSPLQWFEPRGPPPLPPSRQSPLPPPPTTADGGAGAPTSVPPAPPKECDASAGILRCWAAGCIVECMGELSLISTSFAIICMAGHTFGKIVSELVPGLPSITLFLFFGLVSGPFGLELLDRRQMDMLSWISDVALGFIGLSAGGHFHVSEMAGNRRLRLSPFV